MMRSLHALFAITLLSVSVSACGSSSRGGDSMTSSHTTTQTNATSTSNIEREIFTPAEATHYRTYGHEADRADTQKIRTVVKQYYAAVGANNGARGCRLVQAGIAKAVPEDYGYSPRSPEVHGNTCAEVLSLMFKYRRGQPTPDVAAIEVANVRVDNHGVGVALLRAPAMASGEIDLEREGSSWRILQLLGSPLP